MRIKSPAGVFGLKDPIVLTGQQVPAGATHAAPAGTVRHRLRALAAVHKMLFGQFTFLMFGDAVRGPSLLSVVSTAVVFLWNRMRSGRSGTDLAKTAPEPVRVQAKSLRNVPRVGPPLAPMFSPHKQTLCRQRKPPEQEFHRKDQHAKVS